MLFPIAAFITIATAVVFVILANSTPAPTVASMLRRKDVKGDNR
jgi:hypothetical protein